MIGPLGMLTIELISGEKRREYRELAKQLHRAKALHGGSSKLAPLFKHWRSSRRSEVSVTCCGLSKSLAKA